MDLLPHLEALDAADTLVAEGRVRAVRGSTVRASVPGVRVGDGVEIRRRGHPPLPAEVVGFDDEQVLLLPLGHPEGLAPDDPVRPLGEPVTLTVGDALLGRVLDGLGRPIDGGPEPAGVPWPLSRDAPHPLARPAIDRPLPTGIRAVDALATLGVGQRVGLFAGSGVGKSTLLGRIARHAEADVVVVGLIGERGREVRAFLDEQLGSEGRARAVVVAATSDTPALVRVRAASVATAIAEHFRDAGRRVLLVLDSLTRFARAAREVGLAAGEPPVRRGFPPSVFARLPRLLERAGPSAAGAITALYGVLVEGDDLEDPIADEVRGLLDGHIVLSRELSHRGRWPAFDPLRSLSRLMPAVTTDQHRADADRLRRLLAIYERKRDLVTLGAVEAGRDPALDEALEHIGAIEAFLHQPGTDPWTLDATLDQLRRAVHASTTPTS